MRRCQAVIGTLEDADDYQAVESPITADYDAQSAVERELVLRLAANELLTEVRQHSTGGRPHQSLFRYPLALGIQGGEKLHLANR